MRPNVVVVVLDTSRADALEPYGAKRGSTPAIADLAERGVAFRSAYAAASWTLPSHASMFTGLLPRAAGVLDLDEGTPLAARRVMETHRERALPEVLRRAGYFTAAVSTNLWVSEWSGFAEGFDSFEFVSTGRQARMHQEDLRSRLRWDAQTVRARADDGARRALTAVRGLATEPRREPFFWFVNLVECHSPYLPPRPYNDLGPIDRLRAAEDARRFLTMGAIWRACAGALEVPAEAVARMRHLYERSVHLLDDWLAQLLEILDSARVLDDTLLVVTSDHGENFGEGGYMGHAFSLDDRLIHVPLVFSGPRAPADPGVTSLVRLPLMVAEAAEIDAHPWSGAPSSNGAAVAQLEPPAREDHPRWAEVFAEWGLDPELAAARVAQPLTCATDGSLKLQRRGETEELYDLTADPLELAPQPAASGDPAAVASLRAALETTAAVEAAAPVPVPDGADAPQLSEEERRDLEDRMRLLGYL
jgi:arylsulfatase A-like enzyme